MKLLAWTAAGLCVLGLAAAFFLLLRGEEPSTVPAFAASTPAVPVASDPAASGAYRAPASRRAAPESRTATPEAVIHGRCVAAESGEPLAGCNVRLRGFERSGTAAAETRPGSWQDPAPLVTGPDGAFRIAFAPRPGFGIAMAVRCTGRCQMGGVWSELTAGQDVDLGDVTMQSGTRVVGRVADTAGATLARVTVTLSQGAGRRAGAFGRLDRLLARSKEDGGLEFRELASPGEWHLALAGDDELVEPRVLVVGAGDAVARLDVVVRRPSATDILAGTVVDETGAPAADVALEAHPMGLRSERPMQCTTRADGSFEIRRRGEAGEPLLLSGWSTTRAYEPLNEKRQFRWRTTGIRLTVRRAGAVEVFVVDALTSRPVEDFTVYCFTETSSGRVRSPEPLAPHHEGGRATVPGVALGKSYLLVVPKDAALLPSDPVFFTRTDAGAPPLRIALEHASTLRVQVVRTDGSPVKGTKLELVRHWGPESSYEKMVGSANGTTKVLPNARSIAVVLAQATTDDAGRADLPTSASGGELTLKVLGPGHVARVVEHVTVVQDAPPLTVVVTTGATLRGTVEPLAALWRPGSDEKGGPSGPGLWLISVGRPVQLFPSTGPCPVGADGSCSITGIPPGSWKVSFVYPEPGENRLTTESRVLATVDDLRDAEVREVRLDASALVPGRLRGAILVADVPWARSPFWLRRAVPDDRGGRNEQPGRRLATDAQGHFEVELHPGLHRVFVVLPRSASGTEVRLHSDAWIGLGPGQELEHVFQIEHRRALVRVLASDGVTPISGRKFQVRGDGFVQEAVSDGDGLLVVDPAPAAFRLSTLPPEAEAGTMTREERERLRIDLGPVEIPAGAREARCERRLPPPPK